MAEAAELMAREQREEEIRRIVESRKQRLDYSDNILQELSMDNLDSLFERSKREYEDFKAYFKINAATEGHIFDSKIKPFHKLRDEFLELC
jgi:N-glycosylase/DNA lyase